MAADPATRALLTRLYGGLPVEFAVLDKEATNDALTKAPGEGFAVACRVANLGSHNEKTADGETLFGLIAIGRATFIKDVVSPSPGEGFNDAVAGLIKAMTDRPSDGEAFGLAVLHGHWEVARYLVEHGANRVTVANDRDAVKLMDLETGEEKWTKKLMPLTAHPKATPIASVSSLAFSPDGKALAVGGGILYHGHVALLNVATGELLWVKRDIGGGIRVVVAFSPDGKVVCATDNFGAATLLDAKTGEAKRALEAKAVTSVAFSPDGKLVAGACRGISWAATRGL